MEMSGQLHAPDLLPPGWAPITHWNRVWVDPRAGLGVVEERLILPLSGIESQLSNPLARRYTEWAIPALTGLASAFDPTGDGCSLAGCKAAGTWNWPLTESSIEVMYMWSYNCTTSHVFVALCLLSAEETFLSLNQSLRTTLYRLSSLSVHCKAGFLHLSRAGKGGGRRRHLPSYGVKKKMKKRGRCSRH
jgi:hypothetical protein